MSGGYGRIGEEMEREIKKYKQKEIESKVRDGTMSEVEREGGKRKWK